MEHRENGVEQEELKHFNSVLKTFKCYKSESLERVSRSESYLNSLPQHQQSWLKPYRSDLQAIRRCIEHNAAIVECMIRDAPVMFENMGDSNLSASYSVAGEVLSEGVDKVQATLKQLVRDWSSAGAVEREQCYRPIIDEIERIFPKDEVDVSAVKVLVPGAGLGRLTFEIASRGFCCQGNEFSYFMLIVSFFVLNRDNGIDSLSIYPWIQQHVNNLTAEHQMMSVSFPDVLPHGSNINPKSFSMAAGDFLEVYRTCEWNCVATCFFIDCAHNVAAFIETIYKILEPGGVWINLGPLLYHFSGSLTQPSIEPSFEAIENIIRSIGFVIEKCRSGVKSRYCQNPNSMLQYEYDSVFFTCRKPLV